MAIWNTIYRGNLKEGLNILAEHYQLERINAEEMLKTISSQKISYFFSEQSSTVKPQFLSSDWKVFDLPDSLGNFLVGGKDPSSEVVTSNKKVAREGDFIISRLRYYLKETAIVPPYDKLIALSTEFFIYRSKDKISTHLLLPFVLSNYVQSILKWAQTGNAHPRFASSSLSSIYLPDILIKNSEYFEDIISRANNKIKESDILYMQAIQLFEQELELKSLNLKTPKCFPTKYNNVILSQRLDSNHFMPKFTQLTEHIKSNFHFSFLGSMTIKNTRGVQPKYLLGGDKKVVTSQHITSKHLKFDSLETTSEAFFNNTPEAHIQFGDILTYTTGAYVGQTNSYLLEEIALASNHVNILRLNTKDIDSAYVALVLNSTVGQLQTEMHIRGSAQAELYPSDIAKFIVPLLDKKIMKEIGVFVRKSFIALKESKSLLDQAKTEVETLINNETINGS
jgi:restriction endonuclease S subunit